MRITVAFEDMWLCEASNPCLTISACFPEVASTDQLGGEVRHYAGGRRRIITNGQEIDEYPVVMQELTAEEVDLLKTWRGRLLLLRDETGRKVFGSFLQRNISGHKLDAGWRYHVALTFSELTHDEAV